MNETKLEPKLDIASVGFTLQSDRLVPTVVTRRLGIEPTRAFAKWDPMPRGRFHATGIWRLTMEATTVAEAADLLLEKLESRA